MPIKGCGTTLFVIAKSPKLIREIGANNTDLLGKFAITPVTPNAMMLYTGETVKMLSAAEQMAKSGSKKVATQGKRMFKGLIDYFGSEAPVVMVKKNKDLRQLITQA